MFKRTPRALEDLPHVATRLLLVQLLALRHEREQLATADSEQKDVIIRIVIEFASSSINMN